MLPDPDSQPNAGGRPPAVVVPGIVVAAPASGSGKTTLTLAILRAFRDRGVRAGSLKLGPDYIDPAYHSAAGGRACFNLDLWAMRPQTQSQSIALAAQGCDLLVVEGVMGLFDGARTAPGRTEATTADAAARFGWPVVLVIDASGMAGSAAAVVEGFARFRAGVEVAGVVFNRVGGERHAELLEEACRPLGIPVLGCVARDAGLELPDRHLGLVQANEHPALGAFLDRAARAAAAALDLDRLLALAAGGLAPEAADNAGPVPVPPPGQRVAVARDAAFGFAYEHWFERWRGQGAELLTFSPLAGEGPDARADAVFLPGGYPELHAGRIAACRALMEGLRGAANRGAAVYGECGGYMVLGEALTDAAGLSHAMAGLLPVRTTFAERRLSLGYREVELGCAGFLGREGQTFRGHEFHFARAEHEAGTRAWRACRDASGGSLGGAGSTCGNVAGSFIHLVDAAA